MHKRIKNHPAQDFALFPSDEEHLQKLPGDVRELLEYAERGALKYREIAELTSITIGTVKSKINRARTKILQMRAKTKTAAIMQAEESHV